jgi:spermidine/putrescine-binding protein
VAMKAKGLKVAYMLPKEGPMSWIGMFMLGKSSSRTQHGHDFANAWSAKQSAQWLEDNYGYGEANTQARPKSSDLLRVLQLTNPNAVSEPNAHIDRHIPRRALYAKLWQEVKAA